MSNKKGMNEVEESQFAIKEVKRFVNSMTYSNQVAAELRNYLTGFLEDNDVKAVIVDGGTCAWALEQLELGYKVKRDIVKNDTVIISYKKRLYQMSESTGVRYPYVPTNADIHATDWNLVVNTPQHNKNKGR